MMRFPNLFFGVFFIIFLAVPLPVFSDDARPIHIEINETKPNVFVLEWKAPPGLSLRVAPVIYLNGCLNVGKKMISRAGGSLLHSQFFNCGQTQPKLTIEYPGASASISTIIQLIRLSGERHTKLLAPGELSWVLPEAESTSSVAKDYTYLGMVHIWQGFDHLLFLACLIMIAGTGRRILITVTGFTIAHSVTLALSALNIVTLPIAPIEAVIALSIVFLATEIVKGRRETLTWKYPITVSSSFGLLHGFGFAAVLNEIGLPQIELTTGLLFFNVGVEIGQVIFVLAVITLFKALAYIKFNIRKPLAEKTAAYAVGILATYWMIERTSAFGVTARGNPPSQA